MSLHSVPRLNLGYFPTPVVPMPRLRAELGESRPLWIKHDEYSGPGFGGNKVRKLEYELAAAVAEGATDIITAGGLRSNHCRIACALTAQLGLQCHLVLNGLEPAKGAGEPASHALDRLYGAEIRYVAKGPERGPTMAAWAEELRVRGKRPYAIPLGASTPLGACGYARAVFELRDQCEALGFTPAVIFHATASGGTQSGIAAGLKLVGWEQVELVGVSADDSSTVLGGEVQRILRGTESLLGLGEGELDVPVRVDDGFVGSGYGIPSAEGMAALELLAKCEGVVLDPVYTSKAMAGMLARLSALQDGPVLFWHTGGQLALFSRTI
jgi:1-aminocyclopropane-1-carboxylate deaminase/D-cysteine desulfhydrase-like pyridoxal-dependent ACC family enzyme